MMMADSLFEDGVEKLSHVLFSGKEEDFAYLTEQFQARINYLKWLDVMERRVTEKEITKVERRN